MLLEPLPHHSARKASAKKFDGLRNHVWLHKESLRRCDALMKHLRKHVAEVHAESSMPLKRMLGLSPMTKQERQNQFLTRVWINKRLPLAWAEDDEWRDFLVGYGDMESSTDLGIRSAKRLKKFIRAAALSVLRGIGEELRGVKYISVSCDGWKPTMNGTSYQSLHVYFVKRDTPGLQRRVIALSKVKGSHDAANISGVIRQGLQRVFIASGQEDQPLPKVVAIVGDGASNVVAAAAHFGCAHVHCTAHVLNLCMAVCFS